MLLHYRDHAGNPIAGVRWQEQTALSENPTAPRFYAAMRSESSSVFVAAMSSRRTFRQAIERRQP